MCRINKFGLNTLPSKAVAIPYTWGLSWTSTLIGNNTYWCMRSDECWGSQRVSLFSDLHRWFEQIWVYHLMKHKSERFEKFKEFQSEVENHRNKKIKFLRSDHGDKYLSYEFGLQFKQCGIVSQIRAKHHSLMVCPNVVIKLYRIWCDLWCLLPIYCYRFGVML